MRENRCRLTVMFEDPFWVGVVEREADGRLQVCKILFGAEPKDYEVYRYLLEHWDSLRFGAAVETQSTEARRISPKRLQREVKRQLAMTGLGTKAQQALQWQRQAQKDERQKRRREDKNAQRQRRFALRQQKRKEKHRGH